MKKLFFILFILALFILEVKTDKEHYLKAIKCLKERGKWEKLIEKIRNHHHGHGHDYENFLIGWCTSYCDKDDCEDLIDDYFDFDD